MDPPAEERIVQAPGHGPALLLSGIVRPLERGVRGKNAAETGQYQETGASLDLGVAGLDVDLVTARYDGRAIGRHGAVLGGAGSRIEGDSDQDRDQQEESGPVGCPSQKKNELGYVLLSDSEMAASRAFGIAYRVDEETLAALKKWGIDLAQASGQTHHLLPVPAVFLIGKQGTIRFSYVNPNYRVRLGPDVLLAAAKAAAK